MFGILNGALVCHQGKIVYLGDEKECLNRFDAAQIKPLGGRLVTPGLIDCHTHLVYAGNRAREFEDRSNGISYEQTAARGGGIMETVRATRSTTRQELFDQSMSRLDALIREGVTAVEIKSGYGLDLESELRILKVARELGEQRGVDVITTFLGAHAVPPECTADEYLEILCEKMLPEVAASGLTDIFDAFCERIAFSPEQVARAFDRAKALDFKVKLHADQLSAGGGAQLAAQYQALSADHLEYTDEDGVAAMARANTVAVLLPGAYYTLRQTQRPPVDLLRKLGVPIAVATDSNPGTSPFSSLLIAMNLAGNLFELSVGEILSGVTRIAACALGKESEMGTLEPGKWCNLAIWDVERPVEIYYRLGMNPLHQRVWRGQ